MRILLENPAADNPLYLRVALEELRGFGSFEELNDRIAALPRPGLEEAAYERAGFSAAAMRQAGDPLSALYVQVIQRLEADFSPGLVRDVLSMLAAVRRGLSEGELRGFLADHPEVDDLFPMLRQLRPNLTNRSGLLNFYHRGLDRAVRRYYLDTEERELATHRRLAECFARQEFFLESLESQRARARRVPPTPRPANVRKVDELPWQLSRARAWDELRTLLEDLHFLEAKAEAGTVFDLCQDFSEAALRLPTSDARRSNLGLVEEALRHNLHFIARHPQTLFQCLWNSGWWYDCPDAAPHYRFAPKGAAGPPWEQPGPKLSTLLESWREAKAADTPGFIWLRTLRPPKAQLGVGLKIELEGAHCVAFSADGLRIACGRRGPKASIREVNTGLPLTWLEGNRADISCIAFSPDDLCVAGGLRDGTVRVWDAGTGAVLASLEGLKDDVSGMTFSADGLRLAAWLHNGPVRTWGARSGEPLAQYKTGDDGQVLGVSFVADGLHIASQSRHGIARVLDAVTGAVLVRIDHCGGVTFSRDLRRIATASDDRTVRVWELVAEVPNTGPTTVPSPYESVPIWAQDGIRCQFLAQFRVDHPWFNSPLQFSPDGRRIAMWNCFQVHVWDAGSGRRLSKFDPYVPNIEIAFEPGLALSPDGGIIAAWLLSDKVQIWNVECRLEAGLFEGHSTFVESVAIAREGAPIVCTYTGEVWMWDTNSGVPVDRFYSRYQRLDGVTFSRDGRRMATWGKGFLQVWTRYLEPPSRDGGGENWLGPKSIEETGGSVSVASFSADGRHLAARLDDGTLRLWDASSGEPLLSADGRRIIVRDRLKPLDLPNSLSELAEILDKCAQHSDDASGLVPRWTYTYYGSSYDTEIEVTLGDNPSDRGGTVAWIGGLSLEGVHPAGRLCVGIDREYVCLVRMEGDLSRLDCFGTLQAKWERRHGRRRQPRRNLESS